MLFCWMVDEAEKVATVGSCAINTAIAKKRWTLYRETHAEMLEKVAILV